MSGDFQRGLSDALLQDLLKGPCETVLRACLAAGLNVRLLRDNYLKGLSQALLNLPVAISWVMDSTRPSPVV